MEVGSSMSPRMSPRIPHILKELTPLGYTVADVLAEARDGLPTTRQVG